MVKLSLRRSLFGLWFAWTLVALAVAGLTIAVLERGSAALIAKGRSTATAACTAAGARYRLLLASGSASSTADGRERDLAVIMQTSLYQFPGVEGSLWRRDLGFFGYAYPTYEGTVAKTDLPEAERANIETLVSAAALDQATRIDERRGLREAVIIAVCPVTADGNIMAWTLLRVPLAGNDFENLALAAGLVLAFLVGSGLWVAFIGFRWSRAFAGVERTLEKAGAELPNNIAPTGLGELDSVVDALNRFARRLEDAQRDAAAFSAKASQMDRLTALGQMAAGIAHEIRNPVAAMRLKAENALAGSQSRQAAALQTILSHISRIDRLVAEMLALAQPITLQRRPIELAPFVRERIEAMQERAELADVELSGHACDGSCIFDPEQMSRALDNLLINALQHTPEGGHVELSAAISGGQLTFSVADDGPGIDPAIAARLFEPFATSRADGTGLGLSIVREIAAAHQGTVALRPVARGAHFVVTVPCRQS